MQSRDAPHPGTDGSISTFALMIQAENGTDEATYSTLLDISDNDDDFTHLLAPLAAIWIFPGHKFV